MYNERYWKDKELRKAIKALTIKRPSRFVDIMKAIFTPSEEVVRYKTHTRSFKERRIRRLKHRNKMLSC